MPATVIPRGDRFCARVTIGGKQRWLGTYGSREGAEAAVRRARGTDVPVVRTVADLAGAWNVLDPRSRTAETDRHRCQMVAPFVRAHGREVLASITPATAQAWASAHPGSVRYLRAMFETAVRLELVDRNVWERVIAVTEKRPRRAFTVEEVQALVDAAHAEWRGAYGWEVADLILVTAYTGLRLSEVAGLRAQAVRNARLAVHGKGSKPREVAIFGPGVHAYAQAVHRRAPRRLSLVPAESATCEHDEQALLLLFLSEKGRPLTRGTVSRMFAKLTKRAGVTGTFHSLRHFHGTWLLDQGASDIDVAVQLGHVDEHGHADASLVRKVYGHPSPAKALGRLETIVKEGSDGCSTGENVGARGAASAVGGAGEA